MRGDWDDIRARCVAGWLADVARNAAKLDAARESLAAIEGSMGPGGVEYGKAPASSPNPDGVPDAAMRLSAARERYRQAVEAYAVEIDQARSLVLGIRDPHHAAAVTRRCLLTQRWADVAQALGVSESTARRWVTSGLVEIYDGIPLDRQLPRHSAL